MKWQVVSPPEAEIDITEIAAWYDSRYTPREMSESGSDECFEVRPSDSV